MKKVIAIAAFAALIASGALIYAQDGKMGMGMGRGQQQQPQQQQQGDNSCSGCGMGQGMMGPGMGMGQGMGMMGGMMGQGMMGGNNTDSCPMNDIDNSPCVNRSKEYQKFLDDTVKIRRELNARRFDYFEALRNPKTPPEELGKLLKELVELTRNLHEAAAAAFKEK
jgi:hypothetical protein